jgi:hypothetical protein
MDIGKDRYKSLTEIFEIENIVEVVGPAAPYVAIKTNDQGTVAEKIPPRRFRVIAARDLRDPTAPRYTAFIEELIRLMIEGREAHVWQDATDLFLEASAHSGEDCINLALGFIDSSRL